MRPRAILRCRNCDSLAVIVVAHFDPHLSGAISPSQGELTTAFFVVSSLGLSHTFSFSLIKKLICS